MTCGQIYDIVFTERQTCVGLSFSEHSLIKHTRHQFTVTINNGTYKYDEQAAISIMALIFLMLPMTSLVNITFNLK